VLSQNENEKRKQNVKLTADGDVIGCCGGVRTEDAAAVPRVEIS